jgi:flagellar motor switch protein FliN/FliY
LIAQGEVIIVNEKFGAKLTKIISPEERIKQMDGMDKTS